MNGVDLPRYYVHGDDFGPIAVPDAQGAWVKLDDVEALLGSIEDTLAELRRGRPSGAWQWHGCVGVGGDRIPGWPTTKYDDECTADEVAP